MGIILGILAAAIIIITWQFGMAEKKAAERFAPYQEKAQTIETTFGKLTYIDEGEGEVILSCHGLCGGYDQAYDTLADKVDSYRVLAPSRFGYPGSDMPEEPSTDNQVEAFVQLLDQLQIDKVYVLGTSAGGTAAIKFALNHPERTKGLILYCSGYPDMEQPEKELTYVGPPSALVYDFPMWFFSPLFGPLMGMDRDTIEMIMPLKERHEGIVLDAKVANTEMVNCYEEYNLKNLQVPALMIHARDDKLADYNRAAMWAEEIPDCTFVSFETGGHLMVGNSEQIDAALTGFVK